MFNAGPSWIILRDIANVITKPMARGRKLFVSSPGQYQFEFELCEIIGANNALLLSPSPPSR